MTTQTDHRIRVRACQRCGGDAYVDHRRTGVALPPVRPVRPRARDGISRCLDLDAEGGLRANGEGRKV